MTALPLLTWLSPSFPIGAFAYSGGLEAAVARELIRNADELRDWLAAALEGGTIRSDALTVAIAARGGEPEELDALVLALAGSPTRENELRALGAAFRQAAAPWWPEGLAAPLAYPVALGALAGAHGITPAEAATAFALAAATNAVQAAQRLLPIGQRAGVALIAALEPTLPGLSAEAEHATTDDLFTTTPAADIAALAHPTIEPRLFRS